MAHWVTSFTDPLYQDFFEAKVGISIQVPCLPTAIVAGMGGGHLPDRILYLSGVESAPIIRIKPILTWVRIMNACTCNEFEGGSPWAFWML